LENLRHASIGGWGGMVAPFLQLQNSTHRVVGVGVHSSHIKLPHLTLQGLDCRMDIEQQWPA